MVAGFRLGTGVEVGTDHRYEQDTLILPTSAHGTGFGEGLGF